MGILGGLICQRGSVGRLLGFGFCRGYDSEGKQGVSAGRWQIL